MFARQSGRKRFPSWLYDLVDKGEVEGVRWVDNSKTIFTIPWTRVDSPQFDLTRHARVFQLWAEFTGRFKEGERADPSVWKTRFRCAIRKMFEIEEITQPKNLEEKNGKEPFRVFRFKTNVQNITKCKNAKKPRKARTSQKIKSRNQFNKLHNKMSRVTARSIYRGLTSSTVTQSWLKSNIVSHGVTHGGSAIQGDINSQLNYMTSDCVTAGNATNSRQYWPVFSGPEVPKSRSCQEITFSDFSIQKPAFRITNPLPGNNYVTFSPSYSHDNERSVEGEEEECFPRISIDDVNNVLQSCSSVTSQDSNNIVLHPLVMASQEVNSALQKYNCMTSHDHVMAGLGMMHDKSLAQRNVVASGVRTSLVDEEYMESASMECLILNDGYQGPRAVGENDLDDLDDILGLSKIG